MKVKPSTARSSTVDGASGYCGGSPESLADALQPICPRVLVQGGDPI
jgi:hypothetical protein